MDTDIALVSAILAEGEVSYKNALDLGLHDDLIQGSGSAAWKLVREYKAAYGELPSVALVEYKLGIVLGRPEGKADYFTRELLDRALFNQIRDGVGKVAVQLEGRKPHEAYAGLEELLVSIRKQQAGLAKIQSLPSLGPAVWEHYQRMKAGERGISFPWPTVSEVTTGMWPGDMILFVARTGVGKCVEEHTEIMDPVTGSLDTIRELYYNFYKRSAFTWGEADGVHAQTITAKIDTGRKVCYKVTLRSGRSVVVTLEHPFLSVDGWLPLEQLKVGCSVATPARLAFPTQPSEFATEEQLALIGLLTPAGSGTESSLRIRVLNPWTLSFAQNLLEPLGFELHQAVGVLYDAIPKTKAVQLTIDDLRHRCDLFHQRAGRRLSKKVFLLCEDSVTTLLSSMWLAVGEVAPGPQLVLASEVLCKQVQHLHLRLGIQTYIDRQQIKAGKRKFVSWVLRVAPQSVGRLAEAMPAIAEVLADVEALDPSSSVGWPKITAALQDRIHEIQQSKLDPRLGGSHATFKRELGDRWLETDSLLKRGEVLTPRVFQAFTKSYECAGELGWLHHPDLYWDEIVKIENVGEQKIYDLTMEPTKCFVANDILVHNTWATISITDHVWSMGKRVLFATTEMSSMKIAMRFFAMKFRYSFDKLRKGQLGEFVDIEFKKKLDDIMNAEGLYVVGGNFDFRVESFQAAIDDAKPDMVILDGAYLLKMPGKDRIEQAANSFNELKRTAMHKKIPMIITTQLNRNAKKSVGSSIAIENIALSDVGGWNADAAFALLQTKDMQDDRKMTLKPLKIREGIMDDVELNWDMDTMDFSERAKSLLGHNPLGDSDDLDPGVTSAPDDGVPF